jgi:hypothetical protein
MIVTEVIATGFAIGIVTCLIDAVVLKVYTWVKTGEWVFYENPVHFHYLNCIQLIFIISSVAMSQCRNVTMSRVYFL